MTPTTIPVLLSVMSLPVLGEVEGPNGAKSKEARRRAKGSSPAFDEGCHIG